MSKYFIEKNEGMEGFPIHAQRIARLMHENQYTNKALAEEINVSPTTIQKILRKSEFSPSMRDIVKIAKVFNVSVDFLVGNTKEKSPNISIQAINRTLGLTDDAIKALKNFHDEHSGKHNIDLECDFLDEFITSGYLFKACELAIEHAEVDYFKEIDSEIKYRENLLKTDTANADIHIAELKRLKIERQEQTEKSEFKVWKIMRVLEEGIYEAIDSLSLSFDTKNN